VQGTAEDAPFTRRQFEELLNLAEKGVKELCQHQAKALGLA
jgi:ribonuclease PH